MGSAIAWVDGQSALACVIDMSQEVPAEWEYSHISRPLQLFRKGFRAWAIIRGFSDEMGCSQGGFVLLSLPVSVCQQPQLSLNSLLGRDLQQIKMCS